jgi:hypothetical protein
MRDNMIHKELSARWKAYFAAVNELKLVYAELLNESLDAKARGYEFEDITISKPRETVDKIKALAIASQNGWSITYLPPKDPLPDMKALKKVFKSNKVEIPKTLGQASVRLKTDKNEDEAEEE